MADRNNQQPTFGTGDYPNGQPPTFGSDHPNNQPSSTSNSQQTVQAAKKRPPYNGPTKKLVIAFDIGTTFSGVSYAILEPDQVPQILGVTQFPGQEHVGGDSKIPSVILYDNYGNVLAVGAEADTDMYPDLLENSETQRAEWFKLHLRPPHLDNEHRSDINKIPPLPKYKTAIDVFGDLLAYLFVATKDYIQQRQGRDLWYSVEDNIDYVLSHPNGWEGKQQAEMRQAAISAGLVRNDEDATKRVSFVTEGEASLHFCMGKIPNALLNKGNEGVIVIDCGGGTIDISSYKHLSGMLFQEIAPVECLFQGSIFVTHRAREYLTNYLSGTKFGSKEDIDIMAKAFDKTTKPSFKTVSKTYYVRFGRSADNDPSNGIRSGSVKMEGPDIARFFDPAVDGIVKAIKAQSTNSPVPIKTVFLVGGFATSDYLYKTLEGRLSTGGIQILRPDAYLNKAVAEGSVSFYLDHYVTTRIAKYTYGIKVNADFDPDNSEHRRRERHAFVGADGTRRLPGSFSPILTKGTEVAETKEFRHSYNYTYTEQEYKNFRPARFSLRRYRGHKRQVPDWVDEDPDNFDRMCKITAKASLFRGQMTPHYKGSKKYYELKFDVVLLFGFTELKAQIAWKENGKEIYGPAAVSYDLD
ncbi:hypothetical protein AMATHDRAFT_43014 [Amanita thiersii Skay4041]|uniref:Uncharacterized protein n=1 Tax=Amanita thiersii Skay4041 TaxID=703135 RepID=A0A2A9NI34_9AGAR|nr:hypothetical protein AMATHDRAFT_43014 [Amanita thiersii Skay4041]